MPAAVERFVRGEKTMRKPLILFFAVAAATPLFAQSLTEKIDVSLVNVDVTVTSHGAPARGLTRDDFEVLEDGVPQNVTHFYAIENAREKNGGGAAGGRRNPCRGAALATRRAF